MEKQTKKIRTYQVSDLVLTDGEPSRIESKMITGFLPVYMVSINGVIYPVYSNKDLTKLVQKVNSWLERYEADGKRIAYSTVAAKLKNQESFYTHKTGKSEITIISTTLNLDNLI